MDFLKAHIRDVPDFPKPGIIFKDITPLLLNPQAFRKAIEVLVDRYRGRGIDKVAAIEARGFMFAAPLAIELGAGFVPLRKPGKLPFATLSESYELEYGKATLEIHNDSVNKGDKVLLFDDLLATGGTAEASVSLLRQLGGEVVEAGFLIELAFLNGRDKLEGIEVHSLVRFD